MATFARTSCGDIIAKESIAQIRSVQDSIMNLESHCEIMLNYKEILLTIGLVVLSGQLSQACKCIRLPPMAYCRNDFLALVKINDVTVDEANFKKLYSFEVVSDINRSVSNGTLLRGAQVLETAVQSAACGVDLQTSAYYLIGGHFDPKTHQPTIHSCSAFVEHWNLTDEKSTAKLAQYKLDCESRTHFNSQ